MNHKNDPLLRRGDGRLEEGGDEHIGKRVRETKDSERTTRYVTQLLLPAVVFAVTLWAVYGFYVYSPVMLVLYLVVVTLPVALTWRRTSEASPDDPEAEAGNRWRRRAALTNGAAIGFGVLIGLWLYYTRWVFYFRYNDLRKHTNVPGSEPAGAFADVGMISFSSDTRVETSKAVGFQSVEAGRKFCVAPIVDSRTGPADKINFYAVGQDCCGWRGDFFCDDSENPAARSGMLILDPEMVAGWMMSWVNDDPLTSQAFQNAIRLQSAAFGDPAGDQARLLRWVKDPNKYKDAYWWSAYWIGFTWSILILVASVAWPYLATRQTGKNSGGRQTLEHMARKRLSEPT